MEMEEVRWKKNGDRRRVEIEERDWREGVNEMGGKEKEEVRWSRDGDGRSEIEEEWR